MAGEAAAGALGAESHVVAPRVVSVLLGAAVSLGLLSVLSFGFLGAAHVRDTFPNPTANGMWATLAAETQDGEPYRPLYDGTAFGGTRYMPLPMLVYAAGAKLTADLVVGPKLVSYAIGLALFGLLFVVLKRISGSWRLALALVGVALASSVAVRTGLGPQGDSLPVLFQLAAVGSVAAGVGGRRAPAAGALCALAVLAKFSALWAPAAILIWLLVRDRRRVAAFASSFAAVLATGLVATEAASHGRFSENLLAVSSSSFLGLRGVVVEAPYRLSLFLQGDAIGLVMILPIVVIGLGIAVARRRLTVFHLSFGLALALLLVVMADRGTDGKHLLDISVLAVVLVAAAWRSAGALGGDESVFRVLVLATVVWALGISYYTHLKPEVSETARVLAGRADGDFYSPKPPPGVFRASDRILSQDPYVPLVLGQRPVVLDPFALLRILAQHPDWQRELVQRVDAREFDKIVLFTSLSETWWWETIYFGTPLVEAIQRNYEVERQLSWRRLWILVPRHAA